MKYSDGFSLLEMLLVLSIVSILFLCAGGISRAWYQQHLLRRMLGDIQQALVQGSSESMLKSESLCLLPDLGSGQWSDGMALVNSAHPQEVLRVWHWAKTDYHLSWQGFISKRYLKFSADLRHAVLNGFFLIENSQHQGWKLIVNRLGHARLIKL